LYELKKERSVPITHEDIMIGVKKGDITQLVVIRELDGSKDEHED